MKQKNDMNTSAAANNGIKLWKLATKNIWLKIISLVFAILLWSYVVNETNPVRTRTFSDLPVSINGMTQLNQAGLVPLQDLLKQQLTVRVTVNVSHRDYKQTTADTFSVSLDLSQITTAGTHSVPIRVTPSNTDVSVLSISPASIDLEIDTLDSSVVPLQLNVINTLPDDLIREDASLSPDTLTLEGPAQYLSRIARAVVDVDLSKMTDGYTANVPYHFVDSAGNVVTPVNVTASAQSVLVDMAVKTKKTIIVDYTDAFINQDKLAVGVELKNILYTANEITVYGTKDALADLETIKVQPVDLTGVNASMTDIVLTPVFPEGVALVNASTQLKASVIIAEQETSKNFSVQVKYSGLSSDLKATLSSVSATVTLYGPISKLADIKASDIQIIFNLAGKQTGSYDLTLTPVISGDNAGITASTQPASITVTISKK